ncbi:MAG: glycine cleavage system protein GcvH [Acetobacteraceae bacterium]|nr:glycine cleavage system protein GcvH [Acetobacteraceae bacterium]
MYPEDLKYTKTHEWIRLEGNRGRVGLTHYAQDQLGDIVFVELPAVGKVVKQGETFGVVESVKAASDCYAPLSGKVVEVNSRLTDEPATINQDCYGQGWMMVLEVSDPSEVGKLMDAARYQEYLKEVGH